MKNKVKNKPYHDKLIELFNNKVPIRQIGSILGISAPTLTAYLKRRGFDTSQCATNKKPGLSVKDNKDKVIALYKEGYNQVEIARQFGYKDTEEIRKILRQSNVEIRDNKTYSVDDTFLRR